MDNQLNLTPEQHKAINESLDKKIGGPKLGLLDARIVKFIREKTGTDKIQKAAGDKIDTKTIRKAVETLRANLFKGASKGTLRKSE